MGGVAEVLRAGAALDPAAAGGAGLVCVSGGKSPRTPDELDWLGKPSRVGRVLDDGTSQIVETVYHTQGSVVSQTDPLGRRTSYTYGPNGVQLLEVRQTTGAMNDLLASYSNFNALLLPQSVTDAAGQTTTLTYNAAGRC